VAKVSICFRRSMALNYASCPHESLTFCVVNGRPGIE
jgi:hypothetical protein